MSTIKLNVINRSNDTNNSQVVIFQKNEFQNADNSAVAWKVIPNCAVGCNYPFTYSSSVAIAASDTYGNETNQLHAAPGMTFRVFTEASGMALQLGEQSSVHPEGIEITNEQNLGEALARCYRDNALCAVSSYIAPEEKAVFQLTPKIWIGVISEVWEGAVMNSAIISQINTELNLSGISEADIIMTGGGSGESSVPYVFQLENVVKSE